MKPQKPNVRSTREIPSSNLGGGIYNQDSLGIKKMKYKKEEKDKIIKLARENKIAGLNRNYNYFLSFFIAFIIATTLVGLNLIREIILGFINNEKMGILELIVNLAIFLGLGLISSAVKNSEEEAFLSLKIREKGYANSKKKAYGYINELTLKK